MSATKMRLLEDAMKKIGNVLVLLLLVSFFVSAQASAVETLSASGCSVSNVGYLSDLVRDYEKETGVRILVRGGGSVIGMEDLRSGKVDFDRPGLCGACAVIEDH